MIPVRAMLLRGTAEPPPEQLELRAGPLSLLFEPDLVSVRSLRLGGREVLRGIYLAVRDHNWDTIPLRVVRRTLQASEQAFHAELQVECRGGEVDFPLTAIFTGTAAGTLHLQMHGVARTTFRRNRIGFCVLHPIHGCAGQPCRVIHTDGTAVAARFPDAISPWQPFLEIQALSLEVEPGLSVAVTLAGEVFEMEDQRNWTDASFKTYPTPLALPFPVEVPRGSVIEQGVRLELLREPASTELPFAFPAVPSRDSRKDDPVLVSIERGAPRPLPALGLGCASDGAPLSARALRLLGPVAPQHLRVDLHLAQSGWCRRLVLAAEEAAILGAPLEIALFSAGERAIAEAVPVLAGLDPPVARWLIFSPEAKTSPVPLLAAARKHLRSFTGAPIGGGSDAYFAELNRGRPDPEALDFVSFSINPQVHAFDDASLAETLEMQAEVVRGARALYPKLPVIVSPVTLRPRFNPNATGPEPLPLPGELPSQVDPRQAALFGAGWTLGSLKYLAEGGAAAATCYETAGWRGILERETGCPLPGKFPSMPGAVYPLYHVLADYAEHRGGSYLPSRSSEPLVVESLALHRAGRVTLLLGNLTTRRRRCRLPAGELRWSALRLLDESCLEEALLRPEDYRVCRGTCLHGGNAELELDLPPCAVARLEGTPAP